MLGEARRSSISSRISSKARSGYSGTSNTMDKLRVLFMPSVDLDNTNAQSLNVREIALRLDPERFQSTLWYEHEPDPRLRSLPGVRLLQLPLRIKTLRILREMLADYDIV